MKAIFSLLFWPLWVATVSSQFVNWPESQINTTICYWTQPRAALIRDTVYLDGGDIWWAPGFSDGRIGPPTDEGNFQGKILTYNLSNPFDNDSNITGILLKDSLSKAIGGEGNSNGVAPNFVDGGMLANDAGFFLFGGALFSLPELYDPPPGDSAFSYQAYQYGPEKGAWQKGFNDKSFDEDDLTRYVSYGAAVNVPSENKAFYFSGMRTRSGGDIHANPELNNTYRPTVISDYMVELDMEVQNSETWSNRTLKGGVEGRANAEVVWVPVGEQGILVALGGVVNPDFVTNAGLDEDDEEESKEESPKFMKTIDIYDIANNEWYRQPSEGGPGARTRGCAVVAPASDHSSFNIYYYGGYDGIDGADDFNDDVWVLSLPSFTWTPLSKGSSEHARAGHKCFMPYPDQMMVFGGYRPLSGGVPSCLEQPVVIYNLSSGEWIDSYHPDEHSEYAIPAKVLEQIGGDATGSATATTPAASGGWADDDLEDLFSRTYDMDKITTWGPYQAVESDTGRPDLPNDDDDDDNGGGDGLPGWVPPVLGVILGLMLVTALIVLFILWRRRKIFRNQSYDDGTEDAGSRILSWMRGQPTEKAATATVTTSDDTPASPSMTETKPVAFASSTSASPRPEHHEMAGTPIAELDGAYTPHLKVFGPLFSLYLSQLTFVLDTSPPAELSDRALTPEELEERHPHLVTDRVRSLTRSYSSFSGSDIGSTVSSTDGRLESPVVPNGSANASQGQGHMRSLSETLAQSRGDGGDQSGTNTERPGPVQRRESDQLTPVSPPTAVEPDADVDYLNSRPILVSPLRQSIFRELDEDGEITGSKKE